MKKMLKDNLWKVIASSLVTLLPSVITLILWDSLNSSTGPASTEALKGVLMWFALYLPLIMAALNIGVILVTFWDNAKREQSSKVVSMIYWMIPTISLYSYFVCISIILGTQIEIMNLTLILFGIFFVAIGNYMPKCKQNFTIGIRIKWTLANLDNWNLTHRVAGWTWVICGILLLILGLFPLNDTAIWLFVIATVVVCAIPIIFSYLYYKKQIKEGSVSAEETDAVRENFPVKNAKLAVIIITVVVVALVMIVSFSGDVSIEYGDNSFTVSASLSGSITVESETIDQIIYDETDSVGTRIMGIASGRLLTGYFKNEEYGSYTRYSYATSDSSVVIRMTDGSVVVIGGVDEEATKAIYNELVAKYQSSH